MEIIQLDTGDRRQVRQFLDLPFVLYRSTPQWVPPLAPEARHVLDRRHPFYRHSDAAFFLAVADGRVAGRIAVLDNHNYNEFNKERTAFFCLFECAENAGAAQGLFDAAFAWARGRGLERLVGPKGFTALDGLGLLVRGFEHRPAFGIPYNLPYYGALVEAAGFTGSGDIVSGYLHRSAPFPERIHRAAELIMKHRGLSIARFTSRRDLRALVPKLGRLYNEALAGTTGNVPLTDDELRVMAEQLLSYADPRLIKIVMKGDEPIGYLFAYPDISAAMQRTRGRIWPLGWADLLLELKRTRWVNINGAGIVEQYRGLGGTAILFSEMHKSLLEGHFEHADLVQVGVDNGNMQRELRGLGIDFYKMHRMYERPL
ncbi:MAG TPA: hypothetical protein PLJ35_07090 [Anaerolineae bacterium]|nr:hypothetical protein [Anaerolineae bacterium]HPL27681.1 hypothetical protein [Anaerolineae bacterium]